MPRGIMPGGRIDMYRPDGEYIGVALGELQRTILPEFKDDLLSVLRHVHVNVPWKYVPRYLEFILATQMNVEIGFEAEELDKVSRSEAQAVAGQLQEKGCRISLHAPFWDLNPGSLDPLIRQVSRLRIHQFLDLLSIFEPLQVVCHTGFDPRHHRGHQQFWLEHSVRFWAPMVVRAEAARVPLALENVWEYGPDSHRKLFETLDSPYFGFCLDVGHQHSFSGTPLSVWLDVLADYLMEIHLHDNDGSHDAHLPVGHGSIDFNLLFGFLGSGGKVPLLTVEPHCEEHLPKTLEALKPLLGLCGMN